MNRNEILKSIKNIIESELNLEIEEIAETDTFSIKGIDSIAFMAMIIYIEDVFEIEFEFDGMFLSEYSEIKFSDLIDEINKLVTQKEESK